MKANIDADWFAYAHGGATDDEGHPLAWPLVASRISQQIENITHNAGCDSYELYLSGKSNFRNEVATIRPYKGTRPTEKPAHYQRIREYLIKFRGATLVEGMEADDKVSIEQYADLFKRPVKDRKTIATTVLCSIDKDLDMVEGWHYNWIKDEKYWIDEISGIRNFYKQLLTGDSVDNIPGLFGVGKSSALLKRLDTLSSELEFYTHCQEQYEKRFGQYWAKFMMENAQLLWMVREESETRKTKTGVSIPKYEDEIKDRFRWLEVSRQEALEVN